jgi:hypothetical protein
MRCGNCSLSWYGLWYLASLTYVYNMTYLDTVQESDTCINQLRNRCRQGATWWIKDPPHLHDMLHLIRTSKATQPEDKVYAVLALTHGTESIEVHVDYSEPVCMTYSRFARFLIEHGSSTRLLYDASRNLHSVDSTPGLPSWVPH